MVVIGGVGGVFGRGQSVFTGVGVGDGVGGSAATVQMLLLSVVGVGVGRIAAAAQGVLPVISGVGVGEIAVAVHGVVVIVGVCAVSCYQLRVSIDLSIYTCLRVLDRVMS